MWSLHVLCVFSYPFSTNAAGASSHIKRHVCKPLRSGVITTALAYKRAEAEEQPWTALPKGLFTQLSSSSKTPSGTASLKVVGLSQAA